MKMSYSALVVDDLAGAAEPVVAEDVVDVVLGVDEVADRAVRLGRGAHRDGLGRQLRRVDDDDPVRGHDEARVAAAQLRRRVDVGRDAARARGRRRHHWVAVRPPSMVRMCPVTNDAASETRKIAGPTMSVVSPTRPQRDAVDDAGLERRILEQHRDLGRVDEGRHDRVDPDAVLRPFGRPLAGQRADRRPWPRRRPSSRR